MITETDIEHIADRLKSCGIDVSEWDNDKLYTLIMCVIEGLGEDV